ncbi:hypothetical protein FPOA_06630 [Fusarium poae]|uniref:J domain-containing protein n=1 Tax=Fusarium poae TaxID=36050 RepID=A0A1B8AI55_FUSPO|nr:hypothetical protein FPOA_06630 [Fusarium poae]
MASHSSALTGYQQPSVEDASEKENHDRKTARLSIPYGSSLLVLNDINLQDAITAARPKIVDSWLKNELRSVKAKDLETYRERLSSDNQINRISSQVLNEWKRGKRKTVGEIASQIRKNKEVIEFFVEYAFDQCMLKIESPQREAREEIERILMVQKEQGNEYEILGIDKKVTRSQLMQRRREILSAVHPDKNKDSEATNCTQAVNDAADILLQKNQESYQPPAGRPRGPKEHEGMFGPGGFGSESEDSDEEEAVAETDIPDIPDEVRKVHNHINRYIESYFSTFDEDYPKIPDGVRKANNKIKRLNHKASSPVDAYLVHEAVLHALRQEQIRVIELQKSKGAEAAEKQLLVLQQSYLNTSRLRKHQWPEGWGDMMEKAVRERLNEINKGESQAEHEGNASDIDMDDNFNNSSSLTTLDSEVGDDTILPVIRPIQKLRPGYTLLGDKILGYRPMKRYNRYEGQYFTHSAKFFVETPGSEGFKILSGADIGYQAALAYDRLPDNEKNDVGRYLEGVENGALNPNAYDGILSVGAKESVYEMTDRLPETWVQIAVKGDDDPSKAKIVHRSAFRKLVDNADKEIDSFYVEIGVPPPWATTPYPDPCNAVRYMALEYPAPRRRALEHPDRRRLKATHFNREVGSKGYNKANIKSKLAAWPYDGEPESMMHGGGDDRLTRAFEQLTLVVKEQQKEQREYRELLKSALPALIEDR